MFLVFVTTFFYELMIYVVDMVQLCLHLGKAKLDSIPYLKKQIIGEISSRRLRKRFPQNVFHEFLPFKKELVEGIVIAGILGQLGK